MEIHEMITILGPTATGKTKLGAYTAYRLGGEVISADSRQVFRGMDQGTGKDLDEYTVEGTPVPYHLVDIRDPMQEYNVFEFREEAKEAIRKITQKGNIPVLCGGTGLYIESLLLNYRFAPADRDQTLREELEKLSTEELAQHYLTLNPGSDIDTCNRHRLIRAIEVFGAEESHAETGEDLVIQHNYVFGIHFDRKLIRERISLRLDERLQNGMIAEIERLMSEGVSIKRLLGFGLEYKFVTQYLQKELSYEQMRDLLCIAIGQFAKRQETWFRRMEKRGIPIHWIEGELTLEEKFQEINKRVNG